MAQAADTEDQTAITWINPFYPNVSNRYEALHYFETSPFFQQDCNNTKARQQQKDPATLGALEFVCPEGGVEYIVETEQPPHLFVIRKQRRVGTNPALPNYLNIMSMYYILDKVIYQAPTLGAVMAARLRRCVWSLHQGFNKLKEDMAPLVRRKKDHDKAASQQAGVDGQEDLLIKTELEELDAMDPTSVTAPPTATQHEKGVDPRDLDAIPMTKAMTQQEAEYFNKTDSIILTVLSGYPTPKLPSVHPKVQQEQQMMQHLAAFATAAKPPAPGNAQQAGAGATDAAAAGQGQQPASQQAAPDVTPAAAQPIPTAVKEEPVRQGPAKRQRR